MQVTKDICVDDIRWRADFSCAVVTTPFTVLLVKFKPNQTSNFKSVQKKTGIQCFNDNTSQIHEEKLISFSQCRNFLVKLL